ncbi:MAG TPA: VCBS repeat-containing protein, partial [Pyrinomonadaceae bacterium]|nr:VCBS repeat-containing protein [Pyrinomonadaceae bacterium]
GDYQWDIAYNGAEGGQAAEFGVAHDDFVVSGDFDGDSKDDLAVWRPGAPDEAGFWWLNSTDFTVHYVPFGVTGDDSSVVGDYDGDGKDDPAVYRCPEEGGQCHYFYKGTLNNPSGINTMVPWGYGTIDQWVPNPGDFDGDGKFDFCLQDLRALEGQAPQWLTLNGPNAAVDYELIDWGTVFDYVVPGDFDGDGRSDFCVLRYEGIDMTYWILERDGHVRFVQWGIDGDLPIPGDYDGDGSQDIAVSRANESDSTFWILPSNGTPQWTHDFGLPTDRPVASWYVQ